MVTVRRFDELMAEFLDKCRATLAVKHGEYAPGQDDRLDNFRRRGAMLRERPSQVIVSDLAKHVLALCDAVNAQNYLWAWQYPDGREALKQRVVDGINLLLLLAAALEEESSCGS